MGKSSERGDGTDFLEVRFGDAGFFSTMMMMMFVLVPLSVNTHFCLISR